MWKKIIGYIKHRPPQPGAGLEESLHKLGTEGEDLAAMVEQQLRELSPEELTELALKTWNTSRVPGKQLLRKALEEKGVIANLLADVAGSVKSKQAEAARLLASFQVGQAVPATVQLVASSDLGVVLSATEALKAYPFSSTLALLLERLEHPKSWPPARLAEIIISYGHAVVPALCAHYGSRGPEVDLLLLEMLGQLGAVEGLPLILKGMEETEPALRQKAAWAAGRFGSYVTECGQESEKQLEDPLENQLVNQLGKLLDDAAPGVRVQALESLYRLRGSSTLPRIYAALVDRDRVVRTRAAALLNEERELPRDLWQVVGKKELSARELEWLEHAAKQLRESGGGGQAD